jgi:hypothetical protein
VKLEARRGPVLSGPALGSVPIRIGPFLSSRLTEAQLAAKRTTEGAEAAAASEAEEAARRSAKEGIGSSSFREAEQEEAMMSRIEAAEQEEVRINYPHLQPRILSQLASAQTLGALIHPVSMADEGTALATKGKVEQKVMVSVETIEEEEAAAVAETHGEPGASAVQLDDAVSDDASMTLPTNLSEAAVADVKGRHTAIADAIVEEMSSRYSNDFSNASTSSSHAQIDVVDADLDYSFAIKDDDDDDDSDEYEDDEDFSADSAAVSSASAEVELK